MREIGSHWDLADLLELMGSVLKGKGRVIDAATAFGAAEALRELLGAPVPPAEIDMYDRRVAEVQGDLAPETFQAAWDAGRALDLEDAVELVLAD
jgi:hypothetical protein